MFDFLWAQFLALGKKFVHQRDACGRMVRLEEERWWREGKKKEEPERVTSSALQNISRAEGRKNGEGTGCLLRNSAAN